MPRPVDDFSLTAEGAEATLEAIELGAVDFIAAKWGGFTEIDRLRPLLAERPEPPAPDPAHPRLTERVRHQIRRRSGVATRPSRASPSGAKAGKPI